MDRIRRVSEILKREIGDIFERLICPGTDALVTITDVDTSPDLRHAKVYVSIYGIQTGKKTIMARVLAKRVDIQRLVAKSVRLKYTPKLRFILDELPELAGKISKVLDDIDIDINDIPENNK